jgi:hypothetical protein
MNHAELPSEERAKPGNDIERLGDGAELIARLVGQRLCDPGPGGGGLDPAWLDGTISMVNLLQQRLRRPSRDGAVLQACLRDMADYWNEILKDRGIQVRAETVNHLRIDEAAAVALAVIGQELLADAVAQACQDERAGQVLLRFAPAGPCACELSVTGEARITGRGGRRRRGPPLVYRLAESMYGRCEVRSVDDGRCMTVRLALSDSGPPRAANHEAAPAQRKTAIGRGRGPMSGGRHEAILTGAGNPAPTERR